MSIPNDCGHPERPHGGRGMCWSCYQVWYRANGPAPRPVRVNECGHPDRKHRAKGMCQPCLDKSRYENNKEAENARSRAYYRANRAEQIQKAVARNVLRNYGITVEQRDLMVAQQSGKCAVCEKEKPLVVDHDHGTGAVRSMVCNQCNVAIGMLGDDPNVIAAAAQYVYAHRPLVMA